MIIRLISPSPHPTILYGVSFPPVLYLHDLAPSATIPAAWSSQLQILISMLQLEPPSNIHMLDRAVGLVARVYEVTMDVPQKEFMLQFVDGQLIYIPMDSDCVRMLLGVVADVKDCNEAESQRDSMESSACPGSATGSVEDVPRGGIKSPKPGKHKRQRSLLFSLISSLVPKSFSSPTPPPPSCAPPPAPLPPLPVSGCTTSPIPPQQIDISLENSNHLRRRARATLVEVWRRHVLPAIAPQHLPAAGYIEWALIGLAGKTQIEIETKAVESHGGHSKANGNKHRRAQSEGRNALDFGDRNDDCEPERRRCRPPSPFPGMSTEDADRVVYPRREQADEWGVRYVSHARSIDEADIFALEYNGSHDSHLGEHFLVGNDWDDTDRLTFELMERHGASAIDNHSSSFDNNRGEFLLDCNGRLADAAFDMSRCPLAPSDVNEDEQSDDSQFSLRAPEGGEDLPLTPLAQGPAQHAIHSTSPSVSRVSSSRPRSRNVSAQYSSTLSTPAQVSRPSTPPTPPTPPSPTALYSDYRHSHVDEYIASRLVLMDRIYTALEIVRSRAREEGWTLVRATLIGAKNGWMDAEAERTLEIKAKRRAWSSGIKISAPYSTSASRSTRRVWDGNFSTFGSPIRPPGLTSSSRGLPQVRGPIVPTGLSLGIPPRSSPLALYVWGADDGRRSSKYGILSSGHSREAAESKRSSRVTFADNVTKLFPVCEDEGEDLFEPVQVNAVGFPQAVPVSVVPEEADYSLIEGPAGREDDPFCFYPSQPRARTKSMYLISPTSSPSSVPVFPMSRPSTPPPSYQVAIGNIHALEHEGGRLDASALLLQPLSISASQQSSSRPQLVSRPRAVSMPTSRTYSFTNKSRRTSFDHGEEHCEDLSQAYASPPPDGPVVVSAVPAPHEQHPRYAHVHRPAPACKKSTNATILGRTGKEVVFEQNGTEFTVGIGVALGRAEEGRVVW